MAVDLITNDWIDLRAAGADLTALQNVAAGTMCAWCVPDNLASATIMGLSIGSAGATTSSRLTIAKTGAAFQAGGRALDSDANTLITAGTYSIGVIYFVIMRVQFTTKRGFLRVYSTGGYFAENDTTLGSMTAGNTSNTPSRNGSIGAEENGSSSFFDGRVWDGRVYDRFLSNAECDRIFIGRGNDDVLDGMRLRYKLDQFGPAAAIGTTAGLLADASVSQLTQQVANGSPTGFERAPLRRRVA